MCTSTILNNIKKVEVLLIFYCTKYGGKEQTVPRKIIPSMQTCL